MLHIWRKETVTADRQICDTMAILNWPRNCHLLSSSSLVLLHFQDVILRESKCFLTSYFSFTHTHQTTHRSLLSICIKQSQMPICSLAHFLKRTCLKRGRASAVSIRCEKWKSIENSFLCYCDESTPTRWQFRRRLFMLMSFQTSMNFFLLWKTHGLFIAKCSRCTFLVATAIKHKFGMYLTLFYMAFVIFSVWHYLFLLGRWQSSSDILQNYPQNKKKISCIQ